MEPKIGLFLLEHLITLARDNVDWEKSKKVGRAVASTFTGRSMLDSNPVDGPLNIVKLNSANSFH